jgi:uncharacterized protein
MDYSIDFSTLQQILAHLVTVPDDVKINRVVDEQGVLLSISVNPKDMGIVIGKNGIMANSIKTIMRALGKAHQMNIRVEFLEPDGSSRYSKPQMSSSHADSSHATPSSTIEDDLAEFVIN